VHRAGVRRRLRRIVLLLSVSGLSSCAPIYLHSPSLEKSTSAAAKGLPAEADALKPFDDQIANLDKFAHDEDLAVARYWTGTRDAHFARLIAMPSLSKRRTYLASVVDERIAALTGSKDVPMLADPAPAIAIKAELKDFTDSQRRIYAALPGADPKHDLECKAMTAEMSDQQAEAAIGSGDALQTALGNIARLCHRIVAKDAEIDQLAKADGEIGAARKAAAEAEIETKSDLSKRSAELQREIDAAKTFAESGSGEAQLQAFVDKLKDLLEGAQEGTKLAGWTEAGDAIDKLLKAQVCGSDGVDDKTKTDAKCGDVEPTGTTGRAEAIWGMAKGLAKLGDANAAARRSTDWLIAAKAIIAAEKADAALSLAEGKAIAAAERRRAQYLEREAIYLSRTRPQPHGALAGCNDAHCQLAVYVDAWNEGRVPAQVLEYRRLQIEREYAVRRARTVAQKQHALASAATATLEANGAGGLRAELIAQALFDAAALAGGVL